MQIDSVEFAQMEKRIFDGLKAGNEVRPVPSLAERALLTLHSFVHAVCRV
jgi:hypothetical protein